MNKNTKNELTFWAIALPLSIYGGVLAGWGMWNWLEVPLQEIVK